MEVEDMAQDIVFGMNEISYVFLRYIYSGALTQSMELRNQVRDILGSGMHSPIFRLVWATGTSTTTKR